MVLAAASATLAALVLLLFVPFRSPELGRRALQRLGAASGAAITARSFHLRLGQGLALEGVEASSTFPGGEAVLSLDRLVLEHRLLPLLLGRLEVDRLVLRGARLRLRETRGGPSRPVPPVAVPLGLHVTDIDVKDGQVEWRSLASARPMVAKGVEVRLRNVAFTPGGTSLLASLSGEGEAKVETIELEATRVRKLQGRMRLSGGRLESETLRFQTDQGTFTARFAASLARLPLRYELGLKGDPLDLNAMAGAGRGGGYGPGSLELDAQGVGSEPEGLSGHGTLRLQAGRLPGTPLLMRLQEALGRVRVVGAPYRATQTPFSLEGGRVRFERLIVQAESLEVETGGWLSLRGPLELRLAARAPRDQIRIQGVPPDVLDVLTDDGGRVVVPLLVTGTRDDPRVRPDTGALLAQAERGGAKVLARKALQGLGGLFGKKR